MLGIANFTGLFHISHSEPYEEFDLYPLQSLEDVTPGNSD